jgi:hypothetical protein
VTGLKFLSARRVFLTVRVGWISGAELRAISAEIAGAMVGAGGLFCEGILVVLRELLRGVAMWVSGGAMRGVGRVR